MTPLLEAREEPPSRFPVAAREIRYELMPGLNVFGATAFVSVSFLLAMSFFWLPNPFNIISIVGALVLLALFAGGFGIPRR